MKSHFAPVERADKNQLEAQIRNIRSSHAMNTLLHNATGLLLVTNVNRQIVALNDACAAALNVADPDKFLGLRMGEVLHCRYAFAEPGGCGTSRYCSSCGAVIATMAAIDNDHACERICALATDRHGQSNDICLRVRCQPAVIDGGRWVLVYAQDITQQQHWANLENEFSQDLENKLSLVNNYSAYLHDNLPTHEVVNKLSLTLSRVVREVKLRNSLAYNLEIESLAIIEDVTVKSIRNLIFNTVLSKRAMTGKNVIEEGTIGHLVVATDPVLVSRVLIKMLLNALEATEVGDMVKLTTTADDRQITWQVWNRAYIPEHIQLRIFQKFFTTKTGEGYGLGTHRMKLLGETCLGGKVTFSSSEGAGTLFALSLDRQGGHA